MKFFKTQSPLLRNLLLMQLAAVTLGFLGIYLSYLFVSKANFNSTASKLRNEAATELARNEDHWRAWAQLGLDDALHVELTKMSHKLGLEQLAVLPPADLPKLDLERDLVVPAIEQNRKAEDLPNQVVFARLDLTRARAAHMPNRSILTVLLMNGVMFLLIFAFSARYVARMHLLVKESERNMAFGRIAAQVAHDIRSPLAALKMVTSVVPELDEEGREIIKSATARINEIANDLLSRSKAMSGQEKAGDTRAIHPVSALIEPLVSEKRVQYRSEPGVEIEAERPARERDLFIDVQPVEFRRALSNLINNSVEAAASGRVSVLVRACQLGEEIHIEVRDDGKGMPPEIARELGERGLTFGKSEGSGLGVHHAKSVVSRWGGSLQFESSPGLGTTATIVLPAAPSPSI